MECAGEGNHHLDLLRYFWSILCQKFQMALANIGFCGSLSNSDVAIKEGWWITAELIVNTSLMLSVVFVASINF